MLGAGSWARAPRAQGGRSRAQWLWGLCKPEHSSPSAKQHKPHLALHSDFLWSQGLFLRPSWSTREGHREVWPPARPGKPLTSAQLSGLVCLVCLVCFPCIFLSKQHSLPQCHNQTLHTGKKVSSSALKWPNTFLTAFFSWVKQRMCLNLLLTSLRTSHLNSESQD